MLEGRLMGRSLFHEYRLEQASTPAVVALSSVLVGQSSVTYVISSHQAT